jgi:hypothetical protein
MANGCPMFRQQDFCLEFGTIKQTAMKNEI